MNEKNSDNYFEDVIILNSLNLLSQEEKVQYKTTINKLKDENKKIVSGFNNLVSLFPKILNLSFKNLSPPDSVKEKLFEKIKSKKSSDANIRQEGFEFIYTDSNDWFQHPAIGGIKVKQLAQNTEKGYVMLLMKVAAGTSYPSHHHNGAEECYVIEGDVIAEGRILGPGDFHHADGGSDHDPLYTKNGCTLLLVVDPKDY